MGIFGKKRDNIVDLRGNYSFPEKKIKSSIPENNNSSEMSAFGFGNSSSENSPSEYVNLSTGDNDSKSKIAKRLLEMTDKLEDLSNQIYHLKQRLEIIERKLKINYD